jgi:hypothetical protein
VLAIEGAQLAAFGQDFEFLSSATIYCVSLNNETASPSWQAVCEDAGAEEGRINAESFENNERS